MKRSKLPNPKKLIITMLLFTALLMILASLCHATSYGNLTGTIVRVHDGDTFTVNIKNVPAILGQEIPVRINGIDTPEINGSCQDEIDKAQLAKQFVSKYLIIGNKVKLLSIQRDKYFRILATIVINKQNIGDMLIKADLAHAYDGGEKKSWCTSVTPVVETNTTN